jgi:hypothetical protein
MLFLRILDDREAIEELESSVVGAHFTPSLSYPYRWQDWAAPNRVLKNSGEFPTWRKEEVK